MTSESGRGEGRQGAGEAGRHAEARWAELAEARAMVSEMERVRASAPARGGDAPGP